MLLEKHLCDIPGAKNIHDDIVIFGKKKQEHDLALSTCLHRLTDIGLTLRKKKCTFLQTEVYFFGHIYSKNGITPDPERINDIVNLEARRCVCR